MRPYLALLVAAPSAGALGTAQALWVEPLVMPGELTARHARVERECTKCHQPFDKTAQDRLCLACHTDVAADVLAKRGYHGQEPALRDQPCKTCHAEHKGRGADIVHLDRKKFEHRLTDRPLRGSHARASCDGCHVPGKRFREAPSHCSDCHARKDPHEGCLGSACDSCHQETAWKAVRFDHNAGAFPLQGRHRNARCQGCHKTKRYKPTARRCSVCHRRNDKHQGHFGRACETCHLPTEWRRPTFEHDRSTGYPLRGRHKQNQCTDCHRGRLREEHLDRRCNACHRNDDVHHGREGPRCDKCHDERGWSRDVLFDHDSTRFPLTGAHARAACLGCHTSPVLKDVTRTCASCHEGNAGQRCRRGAECERCHETSSFRIMRARQ